MNATRNKIAVQNSSNYERRKRITLRAWTTLFESLRSACMAKAPLLADELYDLCQIGGIQRHLWKASLGEAVFR